MVKNPPAVQEMWIRSLGQGDPLKTEMATYSGILAWRIPWTEEFGWLQTMRLQRVRHDLEIKPPPPTLCVCSRYLCVQVYIHAYTLTSLEACITRICVGNCLY